MKNPAILATAFVLISSCNVINGPGIAGNGNIRTEKRSVGNFHAIKSRGSIDIEITSGDANSVSVEDDDNLLQYVVTDVSDGTLNVDYKDGFSINNDHAKVYVTVPALDKLSLSGSGDVTMQGIVKDPAHIEMDLSGSGNIKGVVDAPAIDLSIGGSGDIGLSGRTKNLHCNIAGSGDINCGSLESENVTVNIAGSGNAHVFSSVHLSATIVGSGDVYYRGNPSSPEIHTMGSGTVEAEK